VLRVWRMLLGLCDRTVPERVEVDDHARTVVGHVRPRRPRTRRCRVCGWVAAHEDAGDGRRRWPHLDLGTVEVWLEAAAPRVRCRDHGIVVA
jgi:transposase